MPTRPIRRREGYAGPTRAGILAATAGLFLLAGCAGTLPIGRLLDDPYEYAHDVVRVEGRVVHAAGALGRGVYAVQDATGTLLVVSERGGVPRRGARIRVKGRVQPLVTFESVSAAALMETDRDLRR